MISRPELYVWSEAAPNLTNLMTRNTFAGATFNLLLDGECIDNVWDAPPEEFGERYLEGVTPECLNEVELREWLRNAPAMKPMYTDAEELGADRQQDPRHAVPRPVRGPDRPVGRLPSGAEVI